MKHFFDGRRRRDATISSSSQPQRSTFFVFPSTFDTYSKVWCGKYGVKGWKGWKYTNVNTGSMALAPAFYFIIFFFCCSLNIFFFLKDSFSVIIIRDAFKYRKQLAKWLNTRNRYVYSLSINTHEAMSLELWRKKYGYNERNWEICRAFELT